MMRHTQCMKCKHRITRETCHAFPDGIPLDVRRELIIHDEPLKNQKGDIVYEVKEKYRDLDERIKNYYASNSKKD